MYQKHMMKAHDKKVHPYQFREGDLMLKQILLIHKDARGKWTPNWEKPYVVKCVFFEVALILTKIDGSDLSYPVNSNSIKKYYA